MSRYQDISLTSMSLQMHSQQKYGWSLTFSPEKQILARLWLDYNVAEYVASDSHNSASMGLSTVA